MTEPLFIQLLGAPRALVAGQPAPRFPSSKVAGLLYFLAMEPRPRSRDTLAGLLWPDYSPAQAKKNLRGALYHLRQLLDPYIEVERNAIGLRNRDAITVDVASFERALADAARQPVDSRAQFAALDAAIGYYHGEFLEGFTLGDSDLYEEWADAERRRLQALAAQTLHRLVYLSVEHQQLLQGLDYATRLLTLDPLREEAHRNLMLILALDGQADAALAHYRDYVDLLARELGVPPDAEIEQLVARIHAGEFAGAAVRVTLPERRRHNLPAPLEPVIDRELEAAWILDALREPTGRLVTIAGLGGMGKTRLALEIGQQLVAANEEPETAKQPFADGVFFVDLAGLDPGANVEEQVAAAIASALQFELDGVDLAHVAAALVDRELLLILDNFETLADAGHALTELLARAHRLRLVVTSRTRLKLRGERVLVLEGLPAPPADDLALQHYPASRLFTRAAADQRAELTPADAAAVAETCRLLHGLPLGIELAAAWTSLLTPQEILHEIRRGLDFLQSDRPDLPARHRSLRAVFERSWLQLGVEERAIFARLSVFRGGFTREAAAAVAAASLLHLRRLHDRSLIRYAADGEEDEVGRPSRYEIAEILRQYVAERLDDPAQEQAARDRHASFYLDLLAELAPALRGGDQPTALDAVGLEIDNIRAALQWLSTRTFALPEQSAAHFVLAIQALFDYFDTRSWFREGDAVFGALTRWLAGQQVEPASLPAQLSARQAWFAFHLGRGEESRLALEQSLATLRQLDDRAATVFNLNYLGAVLFHLGQLDAADRALSEAQQTAAAVGDDFGASLAFNTRGQVALRRGEVDAAVALCEQALRLKRKVNDRRGMTYALTSLGRIAADAGRYADSRRLFGESLQISEELHDQRGIGLAQRNLGNIAYAEGEFAIAQRLYAASLEQLRAAGSRTEMAAALVHLAAASGAREQPRTAQDYLRDALFLALDTGSQPVLAAALLVAARLLQQMNESARSAALAQALLGSGLLDARQQSEAHTLWPGEVPAPASSPPLEELARSALGYLESRAH